MIKIPNILRTNIRMKRLKWNKLTQLQHANNGTGLMAILLGYRTYSLDRIDENMFSYYDLKE